VEAGLGGSSGRRVALLLNACNSRQLPGSLMAASVGEQKSADHGRALLGFVRGASQTTDRAGWLA
jgi:hypothetical protein